MRFTNRLISPMATGLATAFMSCTALAQTAPQTTALILPSPLTLQGAIRIALDDQPQQAIAQTQLSQAKAADQKATASYMPAVSATYTYENFHQSFYGNSQTVIDGVPFSVTESTTTRGGTGNVAINETIFDSGQREVANAEARRQIDSADQGIRTTRQAVILSVTQAFYEVLRSQDIKKVADAEVDRAQQVLDQTQGQIDAGTAPRISISQSHADLANAQVTQLQDQDTVDTDIAALKNAMGIETTAAIVAATLAQGNLLPPLPDADPTLTTEQYLPVAYADRPDYLAQAIAVQTSQLGVKEAKINAGIALSGTANLTYTPVNDIGSRSNQYQILASASYPLFDGGAGRAGIRNTQAQRDASIDQLDLTRQQVQLDVEQARIQRGESFQRIKLANIAVEAAQDNYNSEVESHKEGIATTVDVSTAEVSLTQAQNQYVTAIYDFYEADARLTKALGTNDTGFIKR
jgi:outer membrane protein